MAEQAGLINDPKQRLIVARIVVDSSNPAGDKSSPVEEGVLCPLRFDWRTPAVVGSLRRPSHIDVRAAPPYRTQIGNW